ncbi:hypothetical protein SDJN02_03017 [Cucurbita argyrosperma subsp. argyrosperma]|nr:hypothetical protein SDJN02_03017 [Cucurbita argyrosperma subsp. argyrosperma]
MEEEDLDNILWSCDFAGSTWTRSLRCLTCNLLVTKVSHPERAFADFVLSILVIRLAEESLMLGAEGY